MHETSLALALINKIEALKTERGFSSVKRVVVEIGTFSNVVPDLFYNAFEIVKTGSCAESAELVIKALRGKLKCERCGHEYFPDIPIAVCPSCRELDGKIEQGRELLLKSLEVEDED